MNSSELEAAERLLFKRWRTQLGGERFYEDGAFQPSVFVKTRPRIVFLMKEVNADPKGGEWTLREVVGTGKYGCTWNMIAYWTRGILNGGVAWGEIDWADAAFRTEMLAQVAIVNLHKGAGTGSSDPDMLWRTALRDRQFLREQIDIYKPDLLVSCGTAHIARAALFEDYGGDWRQASTGLQWCLVGSPTIPLVATYHPQARKSGQIVYEHLVEGLKSAGLLAVR
jgi:hypothetical protein